MIEGAVYVNDRGGVPIAATLRDHPSGVWAIAQRLVPLNDHGPNCGCMATQEVQWMIRPDGTVGCTPGWLPRIYAGQLVMFTRVES